ncbi:MAG: DUF1549 domain-containing protein, partial [Verrucomicrobiae bacterium]|nr:DUF1549 domain-containing protein [Verrucomicrobiae bacterium]
MSLPFHLCLASSLALASIVCTTQSRAEPAVGLPTDSQIEFFESRVRPVLSEHCYSCHSEKAAHAGKLKGGLRVDHLSGLLKGGDSGPSIVPGDPGESLLVEAIGYSNDDTAMPPKGKLPDDAISTLTEWVSMGAPWPEVNVSELLAETAGANEEPYDWEKFRTEHWSFRPVVKPDISTVDNSEWITNAIDAFVLSRLEAAELAPNTPATRRILIRRAYLDLIGLPPEPGAVADFLADHGDDAFAKVIDSLLDSRLYGERWARHWLDV